MLGPEYMSMCGHKRRKYATFY